MINRRRIDGALTPYFRRDVLPSGTFLAASSPLADVPGTSDEVRYV
jgi:hypothetical protein